MAVRVDKSREHSRTSKVVRVRDVDVTTDLDKPALLHRKRERLSRERPAITKDCAQS